MPTLVGAAKARIRKQGPCGVCGNVSWAAHRRIDTQLGRVMNGEALESVANDYQTTVPEMVAEWIALLDLHYNEVARLREKLALARKKK